MPHERETWPHERETWPKKAMLQFTSLYSLTLDVPVTVCVVLECRGNCLPWKLNAVETVKIAADSCYVLRQFLTPCIAVD